MLFQYEFYASPEPTNVTTMSRTIPIAHLYEGVEITISVGQGNSRKYQVGKIEIAAVDSNDNQLTYVHLTGLAETP